MWISTYEVSDKYLPHAPSLPTYPFVSLPTYKSLYIPLSLHYKKNKIDLIWNFCIDTFLSVATVLSVSLCRLEVGSNSNLGVQIVNSKIKIDVFCKKFAHMLQTPLLASMWSSRDRYNWIGGCFKNWSELKIIKCWLHISPSVDLWFHYF